MRSNTLWRLAATASVALAWSGTPGGARAMAQQPASPQPDPGSQDLSRAESRKDGSDDDDDVAPEDKIPPIDVTLKEAKRILLDLMALSTRETAVAVHD